MDYRLKDLRYELTRHCNMRCPHCFAKAGRVEPMNKDMLVGVAEGIIEQAIELGLEKLSFTGGEPLYKMEHIRHIAPILKENGVYVRLFTNGTLLTQKVMVELEQLGVDEVQISIDGLMGTHDTYRRFTGSFYNAVNRLTELEEHDFIRAVRVTITSKNYHQIKRLFEDYLLPLELDKYRVRPFTPSGRGLSHQGYMLTPEQHRKVFTYIVGLMRQGVRISFLANCFSHLYGGQDAHCTCGIHQAYLTCRGILKPCGYIPMELGDCKIQPLHRIWNEHPFLEEMRMERKPKGKCQKCKWWSACLGGCKASSYSMYKDIMHPDPVCPTDGE